MYQRRAVSNLLKRLRYPFQTATATSFGRTTNSGKIIFPSQSHSGGYTRSRRHTDAFQWIFLSGQTAAIFFCMSASPVLAEDVSVKLSSEKDASEANLIGLSKIEDGSVVSNLHTSKWRVFTDNGRDFFLKGKLEEAERLFISALQEAKEGFGERDSHVASACNNLAELYRVRKTFDKAEPLYLEAITILEESFGLDDIRVGAALHNLGQFYLVQRKMEEARTCYERALKIKRRVLGEGHTDYADTMFHLGTVLYLQGKGKDSEALIKDSIQILEQSGLGESMICIRRLRYLAQMYIKSSRPADAENVQRKILHTMELSKGWTSLDTVSAAEGLALTLQSVGSLIEAQELLERCLHARTSLLAKDHIQIAANMLHIARVEMLNSSQQGKTDISKAIIHLVKAKDLLNKAVRIAGQVLDKLMKQKGNQQSSGVPREMRKDGHAALVILLQSFNALGLMEISMAELQESKEEDSPVLCAEEAFHQCILAFKKFSSVKSLSDSPEVKAEYLSCLKYLSSLIDVNGMHQSRSGNLQMWKDEIKRVEAELSPDKMH